MSDQPLADRPDLLDAYQRGVQFGLQAAQELPRAQPRVDYVRRDGVAALIAEVKSWYPVEVFTDNHPAAYMARHLCDLLQQDLKTLTGYSIGLPHIFIDNEEDEV